MKFVLGIKLVAGIGLVALLAACGPNRDAVRAGKRTIIATYPVLGAVVKDLVGDAFEVKSAMPNGSDVHEWEPSAKDIEALTRADLIFERGLATSIIQGLKH